MEYSIRKESNKYYILRDGVVLDTPNGNKVSTTNEHLAAELQKALNEGESYKDGASILCYHYSLLDFGEEIRQHVKGLSYETFMRDQFLMLGQDAPVRIAIAQAFSEIVPEHLRSLPLHRQMAYVCLYSISDSIMLPYYVDDRVLQDQNPEAALETFLEELKDFYCENEEPEEDAKATVEELAPYIKVFIKYSSFKEV